MKVHARGAALLVAMLVAALVATVAVALAVDQQRWLADVTHRRDQVQAQSLALAGIQWARQILREDARSSSLDHLGEPWALSLPSTPIASGSIEGRIDDAQARFNLNALARDDPTAAVERARLTRLFASKGVAPTLLDAIADWVDADPKPRPNGGEDETYALAKSPSLAANALLVRAAEITAVRGVTARDFAAIAPFVTALPAVTALNVNTASAAVLAAALPDLRDEALAGLLADRTRAPFTSVSNFRSRLPNGVALTDEASFAVASNFFFVTVVSRQGEAVAQARALLKREGRNFPAVIWQTLE
ncbi:MAG: type II secretion system minor pseudopilin GspK [Betaproteobacteria bacterium]